MAEFRVSVYKSLAYGFFLISVESQNQLRPQLLGNASAGAMPAPLEHNLYRPWPQQQQPEPGLKWCLALVVR